MDGAGGESLQWGGRKAEDHGLYLPRRHLGSCPNTPGSWLSSRASLDSAQVAEPVFAPKEATQTSLDLESIVGFFCEPW